jgi:hypothetical protein
MTMAQETPWSSISPLRFLRDLATRGEVTLTVAPRPDVATGLWWQLTWRSEDGNVYGAVAQDVALLMRRAAARELAARAAWEREAEGG